MHVVLVQMGRVCVFCVRMCIFGMCSFWEALSLEATRTAHLAHTNTYARSTKFTTPLFIDIYVALAVAAAVALAAVAIAKACIACTPRNNVRRKG